MSKKQAAVFLVGLIISTIGYFVLNIFLDKSFTFSKLDISDYFIFLSAYVIGFGGLYFFSDRD